MTVATQESQTTTGVTALAQAAVASGPAWLGNTRKAALAQLVELGLPTTRHEEWRFTSVAPIAQTAFTLPTYGVDGVTARDVARLAIPDLNARTLVFVNGRYAPQLSDTANLPAGVTVKPITDLTDAERAIAEQHLTKHARFDEDAFTALNTAMLDDGLFVHVARGTAVEPVLVMLHIATSSEAPMLINSRNLIVADPSSEVSVVEHYVALDGGTYFTNAVTEIAADENAVVHHYLIERESEQAFNFSTLAIHLAKNADVASHTLLFGGSLVRNNVYPVLDGSGAHCLVNGLYLASGTQHMDNHMRVEHAQPHCDSRQFYKGILTDKARTVFSGRIVVRPGAQKTDAKQTNANLILSDDAQANTKPQLEIYADDVKCTHGATIGQIDRDAVFYLQSRGISHEAAQALMVYSFAAESFDRIKHAPVRQFLEKLLIQKLPSGAVLDQVL